MLHSIINLLSLKKIAVVSALLISAIVLLFVVEKEAYAFGECTEVTYERDMGYFCTNAHNSCIVVTSKDCPDV